MVSLFNEAGEQYQNIEVVNWGPRKKIHRAINITWDWNCSERKIIIA